VTYTRPVPEPRYHEDLAAAYVRGKLGLPPDLADEDCLARGALAGLRLHKFKRQGELPRVRRILGALHALAPESLLDVGSGRGTFLWPLVAAFPSLPVLATDVDAGRAADLAAVRRGGIERLAVARMDVTRLALAGESADVVTVLEVLEHLPEPERAIAQVMRVARRFVLASVPSHEDDNPEHLHVLDEARLRQAFTTAGARRVTVEHVLNHRIIVVSK
jgi:ubiquinone/menaquinone biosynthesis C-methylase UbiE